MVFDTIINIQRKGGKVGEGEIISQLIALCQSQPIDNLILLSILGW